MHEVPGGKSVSERKVFGISVWRKVEDVSSGEDYERILGHPCEHVFRKWTKGLTENLFNLDSTGAGMTPEGWFLQPRIMAVKETYDTERRLHDRELTLETFHIIDTLMPPELRHEQRHDFPEASRRAVSELSVSLIQADNVEQWRAVLDAARDRFSDASRLPGS